MAARKSTKKAPAKKGNPNPKDNGCKKAHDQVRDYW